MWNELRRGLRCTLNANQRVRPLFAVVFQRKLYLSLIYDDEEVKYLDVSCKIVMLCGIRVNRQDTVMFETCKL